MEKRRRFVTIMLGLAGLVMLNCTDWDLGGEGEAPDPVALEITSVTDTSVTLRWSRSDDEDFKSYQVYYSTSDIVDTTDKIADTLHISKDTVKTVTGLDANRHYYFRVVVTTYRNMISASNIVDTTTLKSMIDLTLTLNPPVALSEFSVSLSWEKGWLSDFNQYWVYMDTTATVDSTDKCVDTVNDGLNTVVDGLLRNKKYWFRVYLNKNNVAKHGSNIDSVTTLSGLPAACTLSVLNQSITDTSVTLLWSKNNDTDFRCYIVCWDTIPKIDTFTVIDTTDSNVILVPSVNDTILTLTSLNRDEKYWFAVYVQDTSNYITTSNIASATTDDGLPEPVNVSVDTSTSTAVSLRWNKNTDYDFKNYEVYYNTDSIITTADTLDTTITGKDDTTLVVSGLIPDMIYWFRVYVTSNSGQKSGSNTVFNFPVILSFDSTATTDSLVALYWTPTFYLDSLFRSYQLYSSTVPNVKNKGVPINKDDCTDIGIDFFEHITTVDTLYYKLFHYAVGENGKPEIRGSNEIRVVH